MDTIREVVRNISIVIPALDEQSHIGQTLAGLSGAAGRCREQLGLRLRLDHFG